MSEGMPKISTERQRQLIAEIARLAAEREHEEVGIGRRAKARDLQAKADFEQHRQQAAAAFENEHARLISKYRKFQEDVLTQYEGAGYKLLVEEEKFFEDLSRRYAESVDDAKSALIVRTQQIQETQLASEAAARKEHVQLEQACAQREADIASVLAEAQEITRRRCRWPETTPPITTPPPGLAERDYLERVAVSIRLAQERLLAFKAVPAANFLEAGWPVLIFIFTAIVTIAATVFFNVWSQPNGIVYALLGSLCIPTIVGFGSREIARPFARSHTLQLIPPCQQALGNAAADLAAARRIGNDHLEKRLRAAIEKRDRDLQTSQADSERKSQEQLEKYQTRKKRAKDELKQNRREIIKKHESQLEQLARKYPPRIEKLEQEFIARSVELGQTYRDSCAQSRDIFTRESTELSERWTAGVRQFVAEIDGMNQFCQQHFPAWDTVDWNAWEPKLKSAVPTLDTADNAPQEANARHANLPALRFGDYAFNLQDIAAAAVGSHSMPTAQTRFSLPAVLSYPELPSLLIEAEDEGRDAAIHLIQDVMLRMLASFPPGKVRFTIIDPVGLGQNFSAFMHLADYDERLVTNRIWTEGTHINQRLLDLTEHMEKVIQKYLRNEFASILDYNEHAGEVAEPFQILVIANFPANFSEEAVRRLASIAHSGARCGVYMLIAADMKLKMPRNFEISDLKAQATTLTWDAAAGQFRWQFEDLKRLPLKVEQPPNDDCFTAIVKTVGKFAKDASRVEVPFESIVPPVSDWWTFDSRGGIDVPLGRAGANKFQYMRLGKGTSQHVLISGKTGSGKSTLLNAMITNLAVHYSPEELNFYLIDFKKGVEFKAYATCRLPHARVIAIESEREFGMSVLERLDLELKRRGDLFRLHGVQDVKSYRSAVPNALMPRILLIIDEFQEFFTNDDKIAHDSALLLDRLVRQGRAFGIHILLGSQTLAGAYSLARSTIGQMAVRIALQCSESDAHLILSEDNSAARLLSRPGEAIYNDANGLLEGNHPFQVVWLNDHQREGFLKKVAEMADKRDIAVPTPIVFEGNAAADPHTNDLLREILRTPWPTTNPLAPRAWLGSAVAIKDPTELVFRRQSGSNAIIVGQQEELALGLLSNAIIALAAQLPATGHWVANGNGSPSRDKLHSFYIFDGTRPDAPEAEFWHTIPARTKIDAEVVSMRDSSAMIEKLAEEVNRRLESGDHAASPIFVVLYNLARFRDLKKGDDFSFSDDDSGNAAKSLGTILREGPPQGIHTLVWCDSYNNVTRWLDRQALRDFDGRVLFQMNASDSSNLVDSPAAGKLGAQMALAFSEEQGLAEKFRPYGLPTDEWCAWIAARFVARGATLSKDNAPVI